MWPFVHPRLAARVREERLELGPGAVRPFEPVDYSTMVWLVQGACNVLNDSVRLQKEAYLLRAGLRRWCHGLRAVQRSGRS